MKSVLTLKEASISLNNIMNKITPESIKEAVKIIHTTIDLASNKLPKFTYEKCMLRLLSKEWDQELYKILEKCIIKNKEITSDYANIFIPYCIIKYKKFKVLDEQYKEYIDICDDKYRSKFRICCKKQTNLNCINKKTINKIDNSINYDKKFSTEFFIDYTGICKFEINNIKVNETEFYRMYNKRILCCYKNDLFSRMINEFYNNKYAKCKVMIKDLLKKDIDKLHLYNILIFCYIQMGMFQEAIYYLDKAIYLSNDRVTWYFINFKLACERLGRIQGPTSYLEKIEPEKTFNFSLATLKTDDRYKHTNIDEVISLLSGVDITNSKLAHNIELENVKTYFREIRNIENNIKITKQDMSNINVISLFVSEDILFICKMSNEFYKVYNTKINFRDILIIFNGILDKNRDILKHEKDVKNWWKERLALDKQMEVLSMTVEYDDCEISGTTFIILDEKIEEFPIEHTKLFKNATCYRIPSIEHIENCTENKCVELKTSKFLLDPTLSNTYKRITECFKDIYMETINLNNLISSDFICYFGHGNGAQYIDNNIKSAILFLFGCSSIRLVCRDNFKKNGTIKKFIRNNRTILGCLYEVTDKDLDVFSIELLSREGDIASLIKKCKDKMSLKYLNGCSVVVYGKPLYLIGKVHKSSENTQ